jgi:hypothetical protein
MRRYSVTLTMDFKKLCGVVCVNDADYRRYLGDLLSKCIRIKAIKKALQCYKALQCNTVMTPMCYRYSVTHTYISV